MIIDYKNISGIYMIKCPFNGKFYIGSAKSLYDRAHCHFSMLNKETHDNIHLQRTFSKYRFLIWGVVEFCNTDKLIEREQYYIDTLRPSLNIAPKAHSTIGCKMPQEFLKRKSELQKGKYPEHCRNKNNTPEARKKISERQKVAIKERGGLHPSFLTASIKANTGRKQGTEEIQKRVQKQRKILPNQAAEIFKLRDQGVYQKDIAKTFGISQRLVVRVLKRMGIYSHKDYFEAQEKRFKQAIAEPLFQSISEPEQKKLFE